ncbi:NUDIX hydrolase [Tropicimonas sp. TH_r6]|uniref:NUDIX hydrolase n=1 Tax=Tropicimonas sp. TH_r6 TaxID=3082085 RepID=UPI0029531972|nr:NUDIX hydrolase [Tropicimonas sp. TH_r6]MDV7144543.1 NUDIX hydrolase [Tropicimonas sp. TH_r6]
MGETIKLPKGLKLGKDVRTQYGALCYRIVRGEPQVLLVTSRTRRRWIIPKGWPMETVSPHRAAGIEAWEEGGVRGKTEDRCIGVYTYTKLGDGQGPDIPCAVWVFPLKVKSLTKEYRESKQRRRKWFSLKKASKKVAEPELREILRSFKPRQTR